ncbi:MAG: SDR family oxidoreductase [Minwuiales bacterium]|nr:SDR family oxidoreductase [Minwuiales bacterium]
MALKDYRTALVTGASSGIGAATVAALTDRGIKVHAVARREDRLEKLAEATGCTTHVLDLRDTEKIYETFADQEIDILINNAGLGRGYESFFVTDPKDIDLTLETNVTAALHVVRATAPGMVQRRRGHIVNIGSIAGLYPIKFSLYGASKGAVHLLSQNLRLELQGTGVRSTEICPGRVETEFFLGAFDDEQARRAFVEGYEILKAADIADAILYALDAPWRVNVASIELTPTEQTTGGATITPVER